MDKVFGYQPEKLKKSIEEITNVFPTTEEKAKDAGSWMEQAMSLVSHVQKCYAIYNPDECAALIKSTELELLVLAFGLPEIENASKDLIRNPGLIFDTDYSLLSALSNILVKRFRKKLLDLCWQLIQWEPYNRGYIYCLTLLSSCMVSKYPEDYEKSLLSRLDDWAYNLPQKAYLQLIKEGGDIAAFLDEYSIPAEANMGQIILIEYFSNCGKEDFNANRIELNMFFQRLVQGLAQPASASKTSVADEKVIPGFYAGAVKAFCNYLTKLEVTEYFDELNTLILENFGLPLTDKNINQEIEHIDKYVEFWGCLSEKNIAQASHYIDRWLDLKKIERHFSKSPKKFCIWLKNFNYIERVFKDEDSAFIAMFAKDFVIVDFAADRYSYIYSLDFFKLEQEKLQLNSADNQQNLNMKHIFDARDVIIDVEDEEKKPGLFKIIRIGYNKVEILYLKEILSLLLAR
jgi:hypothetical protein